ncbi:PQQ-dependent sugar dehydrogenase, partial [Actinophytocola sp.]|uniref:PQQ-dependent sugar dehydrogenase n=1 Tax=Actinophytocola sp. TaxID=1872138 RepID=UPI002D7E6A53
TGNRGALALDHRGALLLATGDAGNPAAAQDPNSLAGKLLRLDAAGKPAEDNPVNDSAIVISGLHTPGGVCAALDGSRIWVTDRDARRDLLYRVQYGKPLGEPAWTWPDRPGISGCASTPESLWLTASAAANLQVLPLAPDGTFRGKPNISMQNQDGFGKLAAIDLVNEHLAVSGTMNKDGGTPVSSDDRAVIIVPMVGQGGSSD